MIKKLVLYLLLGLALPAGLLAQVTVAGSTGANGNYTSLTIATTGAFAAINATAQTGNNIVITITSSSTSETGAVALNAGAWTSLTIYPTGTGYSISGSAAKPLIDLNGADNVTIDGRVSATGSTIDLIITNTSTSNTAGTSTIRFINDAKSNIVKYCTLKGSSTATAGGIVFFSTAASGTVGNDNDTISNNNITADGAGRPVNSIYSAGTSGKLNSDNTIRNNNIYDFLRPGSNSYGIHIGSQSTAWTITDNSFYETGSFAPSSTYEYYAIRINNGSGTGFTVTGNNIGGSSASCGGTAWTKSTGNNNIFYGIYLNVGDAPVSSVQNNTIKNFNWSNSGAATWTAIHIFVGSVNIGTTTGNTIGATTGTGSILVTGGASGAIVYGINIVSGGTADCQNNTIGSITSSNSSTNATDIYGINKSAASGTTTISNNIIGSTSTANSINANSASSGNTQNVYGIYNSGTGNITLASNTIANLTNATSNTAGSIAGIYFNGSTGTNEVKKNFIHSLSATGGSTTAVIYGIQITAGVTTYDNNIITLGGNTSTTIYGIYEEGASDESYIYFNTVYIGGVPTSGSENSYALFNNSDVNVRDFRNNIFSNARSNSGSASGTHYAISLAGTTTTTIDYNNYYAPNTGGVLGNLGGDQATLGNWQTATGLDASSQNTNPTFTSAGSTTATDYKIGVTLNGVDGTGITGDYGSGSRGATPSMGAWEMSINKWKGSSSTDWNTTTNWTSGTVPDINSNIIFDDTPANHCNLDQNRSVTDISNATAYRIVTNGYNLTIKGSMTGGGKIDASATSSTVTFEGTSAQSIPSSSFHNDQVYNLTVNNSNNVALNGTLILLNTLTATSGKLDATTNSPTVTFQGSSGQTIELNQFLSAKVYNLTINNANGVTLNTDFTIDNTLTSTSGRFIISTSKSLTLKGNHTVTSGTIDANASSSNLIYSGSSAQSIPSGAIYDYVSNLTVNNSSNVAVFGTLKLYNSLTATAGRLDATTNSPTIVLNGSSAQTIEANRYLNGKVYNLTISNSSGVTINTNFTVDNILSLTGSATATNAADLIIGTLSIGNGTTFTAAGFALTVNGTTTVGGGASGNLTISSSAGTKRFTGLVTIASGATWNNSGNSALEFRGGISTTPAFAGGSGVHTFSTNAQALTGTISIPSLTVTGITLTNNSTLNCATSLSGTGGLTNAATGILNLDGTVTISTLTATASGNNVNYTGGAQTIKAVAYDNLTISGSGAKDVSGTMSAATSLTITGVTLTNNGTITATTALSGTGGLTQGASSTLNLAGTSAISTLTATANPNTVNYSGTGQTLNVTAYHHLTLSGGAATFGAITTIGGNLTLSGSATATSSANLAIAGNLLIGDGTSFSVPGFDLTVTGTTTVGGGASGNLTISSATGTKTFTGLVTIASGATWNNSGNSALEFRNGISTTPAFTGGSGVHTFTTNAQALTGTLSIPSVTITGITLTNNGTLTCATALSGTGGLTNGAAGVLNLGGTSAISTLTATAVGNTVDYTGTGQALKVTTYHHLNLSGGPKTFGAISTVNGNLTLSGTATATTGGNLTIDGNLTIGSGTTFSVSAGDFVTVTGTLTNSQTLNLLSASGGTASLLTGSVSGAGTTNAERYITGGTGNVWHNLSSSVSGYSISSFIGNAANNIPNKGSSPTIYGMEYYDEPNGVWTYFTSANIAGAGNLLPGKGYLVRRDPSGVVTFSGLLNSGNISPSAVRTRFGWNAVGNPYPSSIGLNTGTTATNFLGANTSNLFPSFVGAYFWSGTTYTLINNSSAATYLLPGQGFVVKVAVAATDVDFTPAMQAHNNPSFLKKSSTSPWNEVILNLTREADSLYTIIRFRDDMTRGLDISYDGGLFRGDTLLRFYSQLLEDNGIEFMIQCLPSMETETMIIPIGLKCVTGGLVSFNAKISSLPEGYVAVLEDRLLGIFTDLNLPGAKYEVTVPAETNGTGRFYLHVTEGPDGINQMNSNSITLFSVKNEIHIRGLVSNGSKASVYDIMGRKIADYPLEPVEMNIFKMNVKEGIYIVKITDKEVIKTERVFIGE